MIQLELWGYTFRALDLPALAAVAGAAGFPHITTTPEQFVRSGGFTYDLAPRIIDQGVSVTWIDGLCNALPSTPASTRRDGSFADPHEATLDDCIRIAHHLGAPAINLVHIGGAAQPLTALVDAFGDACRRAAAEGLQLGIEFLPGTGIPDLATAAAIVHTAGESNGWIVFDSWHWARSGDTLDSLDPATMARIGGMQLSDRTPDQDAEPYVPMRGRKLPGAGALPLANILRRLFALHPDLPIGAEILSAEIDALESVTAARQIAEACRSIVTAAQR